MVSFIGRRLIAGVFLVVGISFVAFILTNLVPGDPAAAALGQRAIEDPATVAAFRAKYGLDQPLWRQYLIYLGNLVQGDLGTSQQTRRPVGADIAQVPARHRGARARRHRHLAASSGSRWASSPPSTVTASSTR